VNFFKKTLPLAIGVLIGFWAVIEIYIPHHKVGEITDELRDWGIVLSAAAFALGAVNLLQVTLPKIRRREPDWQFKVVMLSGGLFMFAVGFGNLALEPGPAGTYTRGADDAGLASQGKAVIVFDAPADTIISVGGASQPARDPKTGAPARVEVDPGTIAVKVQKRPAGYKEFAAEIEYVTAGDVIHVTADPPMTWGKEGRVFTWMYDNIFRPCDATMFSLLAFFIASAAFRAFRARNIEAALLLGAAILVLLGRAPIGRAMSETLPAISDWIVNVPNNGSRRAIMMGAAMGAIATGLRVILGLERSHLGRD
jgi:hypothetical protein